MRLRVGAGQRARSAATAAPSLHSTRRWVPICATLSTPGSSASTRLAWRGCDDVTCSVRPCSREQSSAGVPSATSAPRSGSPGDGSARLRPCNGSTPAPWFPRRPVQTGPPRNRGATRDRPRWSARPGTAVRANAPRRRPGQALLLPAAERTGQLRLPVLQPVLLQRASTRCRAWLRGKSWMAARNCSRVPTGLRTAKRWVM